MAVGKSNFRPLKLGSESLKVCFFSNGTPLKYMRSTPYNVQIQVIYGIVQYNDHLPTSSGSKGHNILVVKMQRIMAPMCVIFLDTMCGRWRKIFGSCLSFT